MRTTTLGGSTLRILSYHRLEDPAAPRLDLAPDLVSATAAAFERHLQYLTGSYHPISAAQLLDSLQGRSRLPRGAVLITFDDAYRDFGELAWPLLKFYHVPAVLFVPTAFAEQPDRVFWWDALWQVLSGSGRAETFSNVIAQLKALQPAARDSALTELAERLGVQPQATKAVLSWSELRQLQSDGATIAAHSQTHQLLDQISGAALTQEVQGCRDDLVRELGTCAPLFAYPNGNVNAQTVQALRSAGFQVGFTTVHGWNRVATTDRYLMRRDDGRASLRGLIVKLLGPVSAIQAMRHRLPSASSS
ncbi:MAG TPA: polysaccharide deacetylase family protein [Chloroflexota bacterium]|jgi:peptidoglycan/xylan/chitin deacetylase (PgdA/CDA1 family)|nr:polysaccharide deacetylase family protein [Chloroflexota bacterium]